VLLLSWVQCGRFSDCIVMNNAIMAETLAKLMVCAQCCFVIVRIWRFCACIVRVAFLCTRNFGHDWVILMTVCCSLLLQIFNNNIYTMPCRCHLHCGTKNRTPVIFSHDFNKFWSIYTIFGTLNKQWVFSVHMCNCKFWWNRVPA